MPKCTENAQIHKQYQNLKLQKQAKIQHTQ